MTIQIKLSSQIKNDLFREKPVKPVGVKDKIWPGLTFLIE